jgi:outer membrane autotransporter protein
VPSLNPIPFTNTGTISFVDGAPDDTLTIIGDFAGDGDINLDVSGLHGTSDQLYIDGSVVDGSVNTINLNVLDMPTTTVDAIPVVAVSGDSSAGSFVLGDVHFNPNNNFLSLAFGLDLVSDIDTTNATPDVFSVAVAVTGLSDPGTLAAAIAPGAQSLMNSQVGTWRQRMGMLGKPNKGGTSLWARVFQDDGTITPEHVAANFGQGGNFAFDQNNSGEEAGVDFAVSDEVSLGLLLGKARASQDLDGGGAGSNRISGDTKGVYGTWISPTGFYLDASYRWMNFDARLRSAAGETRTNGQADAFNLEMGYAWTLASGAKIEPQLQYTSATVDSIDVLTGALTGFKPNGGDSSRGRAGVMFSKAITASSGNAVWTPYASVNAVREFDGKTSYAINGNFFGETRTEGTSALVEGGLNVQTGKWSLHGGVNWQDGGALKSFVGGQLGVRYSW